MVKLLFSDMDGTLINGIELIHPKNIEMMKRWREQGNLIALCTGRNIMECMSIVKRLQIPYDYLILNNGGHILDREKTLFEEVISYNVGCAILDYTTQFNELWSYYCDGMHTYSYFNGKTYDHSGIQDIEVDLDFKELYHQAKHFQILCFNQNDKGIDTTMKCFCYLKENFKDVELHLNQFYVDIVPLNCSKGSGVKKLLSLIDRNIDQTYAIGDSYNDISMFDNVDISASFDYSDINVRNQSSKVVSYVYELLEGNI